MPATDDFAHLYQRFDAPVLEFDCGSRCAPYNSGVPVCCDTCHSVPSAYPAEWEYLQANTGLWHPWQPDDPGEKARLAHEAGPGLILIECLGAAHCEREFRSLVCRAFPFFPYIDSRGAFLGLSIYWEYEDRCWLLSNLARVSPRYRSEFVEAHEQLFRLAPAERGTFQGHADHMRERFAAHGRHIPLLHRDGGDYLIDPLNERLQPAAMAALPKYGPFAIADRLPFPGED